MLRLLIAVDGSEHARNAIDTAARLGREGEVEAVLLHVREEHAYHGDLMPREYERIDEQARQHQAQILEAALGHAQRAGLSRLETQGEAGTPEVDIPRVAAERRAEVFGETTATLFVFAPTSLQALTALDPREAIGLELPMADGAMRLYVVEVGDLAAAYAFAALR